MVLLLCCWSRALLQALAAAPPSAFLSPAGGCLAELHQAASRPELCTVSGSARFQSLQQ